MSGERYNQVLEELEKRVDLNDKYMKVLVDEDSAEEAKEILDSNGFHVFNVTRGEYHENRVTLAFQ